MTSIKECRIQIPLDTKLAIIASLHQVVDVGDHILHIYDIQKIYGDENKTALYAWDGFQKATPAVEKQITKEDL